MTRGGAALGSLAFLVLAPGTVAGLVPYWLSRWRMGPPPLGVAALGQALLLGSGRVAAWGAALWLAFHLFVVGYEEPTLRRTFGAEYEAFRANVPRWLPRLRRWAG